MSDEPRSLVVEFATGDGKLMLDLSPLVDAIAAQVTARVARLLEAQQPRTDMPVGDALRMKDAGSLLGLSEREVQRQVLKGTLPSMKVGRVRLIPRTAIQAFIVHGVQCVDDTHPSPAPGGVRN